MDEFLLVVEENFQVIDEAKEKRGILHMQVIFCFGDDFCSGLFGDDIFDLQQVVLQRALVFIWVDCVLGVFAVGKSADTIW